jgi:peptidoglycan hydrolase FlgJ
MTAPQNAGVAGALAFDAQNLDQLKLQAKRDPAKAIGATAKQFEAMFLGMVLKSMREATPKDGLFDSEQTKLYTSMLDQQLAQHLSARGTGLAEVMTRQLSGAAAGTTPPDQTSLVTDPSSLTMPITTLALASLKPDASAIPAAPTIGSVDLLQVPGAATPVPNSATPAETAKDGVPQTAAPLAQTSEFVNRMWTHAVDAARSIGVQPRFMIGQAALESGWGRHEIRTDSGQSSHNVFGIKAGRNWNGPVVEKTTTEFVNGVAQKTTAKFRVYGSYAEAFRDYASLLRNNPRYANVLGQSQDAKGFARGLQQGGYATDPAYADKLVRVINGATLRHSLLAAAPAQVVAQQ